MPNEITPEMLKHPFRFVLTDGGGTYLSEARTVEQAEAELRERYGNRLLRVTRADIERSH